MNLSDVYGERAQEIESLLSAFLTCVAMRQKSAASELLNVVTNKAVALRETFGDDYWHEWWSGR